MTGKANLEVRPKFVNKGEIAKKLIVQHGDTPDVMPDFVFCLGDDSTDEGETLLLHCRMLRTQLTVPSDMFRALRQSKLPPDCMFSCTVGASSKQTLASWHLLEPSDVISAISLLNGSADAGNAGAVAVVEGSVSDSRL